MDDSWFQCKLTPRFRICPEWHNLGIIVGRRARIARFWTILASSASWRGRGTRGQVQVLPLRGPPVDSESAIKTLANVPQLVGATGVPRLFFLQKQEELSAPFGPFQPPWSRSACRPQGLVKKNDLVNAFTRERWGDRGWKPALLNETTPLYAGPLESCGAARPGARHVFTSATMEYIGFWAV